MTIPPLTLVLPDIRSAQNVGSLLRTADAVGAVAVITCGYTPHPRVADDLRPGHVIAANTTAIAKTALGAHTSIPLRHYATLGEALIHLRHNHYTILALEQAETAINLYRYNPPPRPLALIVGNEVTGLDTATLASCDHILELPMLGRKESLNVAVAGGIALYHLRFSQAS